MTKKIEQALRQLQAEVYGALGIARPEIVAAIGETNVRCIELRLSQAEDALASHAPSDSWVECRGCQRTGWCLDVVKLLDAPSEAAAQPTLRDPTPAELDSPQFNAVWNAIKRWDISRDRGRLYANATGTDVCTILDALAEIEHNDH